MLTVEDLERALPSMTRWRSPSPRGVNWTVLAEDLGAALPSDYRAVAEAYQSLLIDDFLSVSVPRPRAETSFASSVRHSSEILRDLYEMGDTEGYVPYPDPGGLLCWGDSDHGDYLFWRMSSPDPDTWPVVVRGDNGDWSEFSMGFVEFMVAVYRRTIQVPGMPENFPGADPQVKAIGG